MAAEDWIDLDLYDEHWLDIEDEVLEHIKVLHRTPTSILVKRIDGATAWFPSKYCSYNSETCVLQYDFWFIPRWSPTRMPPIEGDFI